MKNLPLSILLASTLLAPASAAPRPAPLQQAAGALLREADARWEEGSFELARRLYEELDGRDLGPQEARWVDYRLADSRWRSQAAAATADPSVFDAAEEDLRELLEGRDRPEERDRVWAEVQESLGDFRWDRREAADFHGALGHYREALDWWARSRDLDLARERYLSIVWRLARPSWYEPRWGYGVYGNQVPADLLENAARIASTEDDRAHALTLLGLALVRDGDHHRRNRAGRVLREVVDLEARTEWLDDALFALGQWLEGGGEVRLGPGGAWETEPRYPEAVAVYRRLLEEFRASESRFWEQAQRRVEEITGPRLSLAVGSAFRPGALVSASLSYRNVRSADLVLYAVDLARDVRFADDTSSYQWLDTVATDRLRRVRAWTHDTGDEGRHVPGSAEVELEEPLDAGAYVLVASGAGERSRALVLVTDAAVVLKSGAAETLVWATSALEGRPLAGARVDLFQRERVGGDWRWERRSAIADEDGLASFPFERGARVQQLFCAVRQDAHQAFALSGKPSFATDDGAWRVAVATDRPAYRPGDEVSWKVVARTRDGGAWVTPAGAELEYAIVDALGAELESGTLVLSEFGSAYGAFRTPEDAGLGVWRMRLERRGHHVANEALCRVEEYRLPEFEVSVELPSEDGAPLSFRPGDSVRADVVASYYFGGPVAGAEVEVVVTQRSFSFAWAIPREYAWLDDVSRPRPWMGGGTVVARQSLVTDEEGRAEVVFDTPEAWADFEYVVEARVVEASRREVSGSGTVRVTRSPHALHVRPLHRLHRPGEPVELELRAQDPNGRGLSVLGDVRVLRERWVRTWRGPKGELRQAPAAPADGWELAEEGYESELVHARTARTDAEGLARVSFRPETAGAYRVVWETSPEGAEPARAEAWVWVCDETTRVLGYHHGGVEILLDADSVEPGQRVPVLVSVETPGRHVLFTVECEELMRASVLDVPGSVRLVWLEVGEEHVPNVFLSALTVHDGELHSDLERVSVPPVSQFLDVELSVDAEELLPGDEGRVSVLVRDADGEPVRAELSLAVVDEAITAIQEDLAPDPRAYFHGQPRPHRVQTGSSFHQLAYADGRRDLDRQEEGRLGAPRAAAPAREGGAYLGAKRAQVADELEALGYVDSAVAGAAPAEGAAPTVRSDFRKTAYWKPDVVTGADGRAEVELVYPESLTRWRSTARVVDTGARVGLARTSVRTRMPLMARLAAPRFLQTDDAVVLSGIVSNRTGQDLEVEVALAAEGLALAATPERVHVPSGADVRVDRTVRVEEPGPVRLVLTATGGGYADAVEQRLVAHRRGQEVRATRTTSFEGERTTLTLDLPPQGERHDTRFTVTVTPSLAVTMLDALPYLVDYPYGCTEQTLSRFLPAVITARTLQGVGLDADEAMRRVFGGVDPGFAASRHAEPGAGLAKLDEVTAAGLARLVDFQHADGGWGWWKGGSSDLYMSGYALWGLTLADRAGVDVPRAVLDRGARFLADTVVRAELDPDLTAWCLHALAAHRAATGTRPEEAEARAFQRVWEERSRLGAQGRALFALAAADLGRGDEARVLLDNLSNGVRIDEDADGSAVARGGIGGTGVRTAHWGGGGLARRWSEGGVETTATVLRALLAIDPEHELVRPTVLWLVRNRRGAQWAHTRETSQVVLALAEYLEASGELGRGAAYAVRVNGDEVARVRLTPDEVLGAPPAVEVDAALLEDGPNSVEVVRLEPGEGLLHVAATADFFSTEDPIPPRGHELFVRREYYRLVSRPTLLAGHVTERVPLADGERIASGERLEVVLVLEAKSDLEYVVAEDWKPAGLEAVEVRSGGSVYASELRDDELRRRLAPGAAPARPGDGTTGRRRWVHRELRDRRAAFFLDRLPAGAWELRYELRAETPGTFHALPARGEAMYAPEIGGNGAEWHVEVGERGSR